LPNTDEYRDRRKATAHLFEADEHVLGLKKSEAYRRSDFSTVVVDR
jgi:hypothetical protein